MKSKSVRGSIFIYFTLFYFLTIWITTIVCVGRIASAQNKTLAEKVEKLKGGLYSIDYQSRREAAIQLMKIARDNPESKELLQAIPAVLKALSDERDEVKLYAAIILGIIGDESVIPALEELTKQKPTTVCELSMDFPRAAVEAIEEIKHREKLMADLACLNDVGKAQILTEYLKSLNDRFSWPNYSLVEIKLVEIGNPAVPMLIDLLQYKPSRDPWGRWYVIQVKTINVLAKIGDKRAISSLKGALNSKYPPVVTAAESALKILETE